MKKLITTILALVFAASLLAQDIALPAPIRTGGKPLMDCLNQRKTSRDFNEDKTVDNKTLSNLLWAAWGYNRDDKRTAPSSSNKQEMDIYVALKTGLYLWDAKNNVLKFIFADDIRKQTGKQVFVGKAPVEIIFVADKSKMSTSKNEESMMETAYADAGFISQNIYLFCASEGLGTVVRGYLDREGLGKLMNLNKTQFVVFAQTVGYTE